MFPLLQTRCTRWLHPVTALQALLEEWRGEVARKPLAMSEQEACAVLGVHQQEGGQLQEGPVSEDALKAAYRSACMPDTAPLHK